MTRLNAVIVLHTNDIHGRIDGLARIATLVESIRAENSKTPVLYFDLGDVEEASVRLSNVTKGTGMHRLLSVAGCDAAAVGNAAPSRYGPVVLQEHAAAAAYPLLLANLRLPDGAPVPGAQPSVMIDVGPLRLGLIGVTSEMFGVYEESFGLRTPPVVPLIRELAAALRQDGADAVVLLSHMGLEEDREIAAAAPDLDLVLGGHSHNLLPEGEWVNGVPVAHAGQYAEHLGRVDLQWDGERLAVTRMQATPVGLDVEPSPTVMNEAAAIEVGVREMLDEVIGELAGPLDFAANRECGVANLAADMLRERMAADVGVVAAGQAFTGPLPAGPLHRGALWDVCPSTANPGAVALTGAQLSAFIARGLDPVFAADRPHGLRGQMRGLFHLSGACLRNGQLLVGDEPVQGEREYRVAATDWELEPYGEYAPESWGLKPAYETPTIMREALEAYIAAHSPLRVTMGRLG